MSEQAEKLARRMAREVPAEPPYYSGESEFVQHEDDMTAALLPFAEVMVRLVEASNAYVECGQFKLILQHGRGTDAAVKAEKLARAALAAFDALVKEGE